MDFNNICRTCLSPNNLNPIFTNVIDNANNLDIIYAATGVMVSTTSPSFLFTFVLKLFEK